MNKTCFLLNRRSLGWGDHGNERLWKSGFRSIWRCISCSSILVNCANKTAGRRYGFYVLRDRYSFLFYNMSFMKTQISLCRLTKYLGELEFLEYLQHLRTFWLTSGGCSHSWVLLLRSGGWNEISLWQRCHCKLCMIVSFSCFPRPTYIRCTVNWHYLGILAPDLFIWVSVSVSKRGILLSWPKNFDSFFGRNGSFWTLTKTRRQVCLGSSTLLLYAMRSR